MIKAALVAVMMSLGGVEVSGLPQLPDAGQTAQKDSRREELVRFNEIAVKEMNEGGLKTRTLKVMFAGDETAFILFDIEGEVFGLLFEYQADAWMVYDVEFVEFK